MYQMAANVCKRTVFAFPLRRSICHVNKFGSLGTCGHRRISICSTDEWSKTVSKAEKIVGYPTSYLNLRCLLSDEMSNIAMLARKIVGTGHPLLKTIKNLIYIGKNNVQTRGLIILLLSKAVNNLQDTDDQQPGSYGVMQGQRTLAEIVEMIHMAFQIHKGLTDLSTEAFPDKSVIQDMHFGNKIAVLSGDFILVNACMSLAGLKNNKVVDLIGTSIGHFTEAEFIEKRDKHGRNLLKEDLTIDNWIKKNTLAVGSLMGNSCKAALELANHDETIKEFAYQFGQHVALAWQAHSELQMFLDEEQYPPGTPLDLTSAPVIFCHQSDSALIEYLLPFEDNVEHVDYKKIKDFVHSTNSIEKTRNFYKNQAKEALASLEYFPQSDAKEALQSILKAL